MLKRYLRNISLKKGLNPNETLCKNIITAILNPTNVPSSQIPHIANYYIMGDFVAMLFGLILLKAGKLNSNFIKAHSIFWKLAHNTHEPRQGTDSPILHEGTSFSQFLHKKTSETLFSQQSWQNVP
jgi:hypothetical protein